MAVSASKTLRVLLARLMRISCSLRRPATVMEEAMSWWSWLAIRWVWRSASFASWRNSRRSIAVAW